LDPGPFGTLGVGAGFALGAKLVRPESEVWIIYGDGALGFSIAEFDTFVRHNIPVIAVVGYVYFISIIMKKMLSYCYFIFDYIEMMLHGCRCSEDNWNSLRTKLPAC
jgi:TPP-dependent 2-oxoacid decarboxylase